jgi:hypothetical protein
MAGSQRRLLLAVLALVVVGPLAYYGVQASLRHGSSSRIGATTLRVVLLPPPPAVTLAPPLPEPRELDAMAYDDVHDDVVLYGGAGFAGGDEQIAFNDTWVFDSHGWHEVYPATSPAIDPTAMAEDPVTHDLVLVGTAPVGPATQTWTWDGATWTRRADLPVTTQTADSLATFSALDQLVLVTTSLVAQSAPSETWLWTGAGWKLQHSVTSLPADRSTAMLVGDPAHRRVLALVTGVSSLSNETWSWDGATWTHVSIPVTPLYDPNTTSVAYDPQSREVVLYATGSVSTTWALDGSLWREVNQNSPVVDTTYHGAMLLTDTRVGNVIMLGTAKRPNPLNALWIYTGSGWYAMQPSVLSTATVSGPPHATAEP